MIVNDGDVETVPVGVEVHFGITISIPVMTSSELMSFASLMASSDTENWRAIRARVSSGCIWYIVSPHNFESVCVDVICMDAVG